MMKRVSMLTLLVLALAIPGGAQAEPTEVGTDQAGDFGRGTDPDLDDAIAEAGAAAGMDLISAAIERDGDIVNFIIGVTALPASGGTPEAARYIWNFEADGEEVEISGKFTDYSRGACDPTSGACPPPRDPGEAPFSVRGNCILTGSVKTCEELALVHATFDQASATITVPVPIEYLGCEITPGPGANISDGGESIVAIPAAFFSSSGFPKDNLRVTGTAHLCPATA